MPIISEFFGIKIYMYWREHMPPHFHAMYGDFQIIVDIQNGAVLSGVIPFKQLKLILAWCELHREELMKNWNKGINHEEFSRVDPLN